MQRPVLVGIGTAAQRVKDPRHALEPIELMIKAALAAGHDAGHPGALASLQRILVPRGRWRYGDPGREIARRLGSSRAVSVLAKVGVLQQSLIAEACGMIAAGEIEVALVVGGEAGDRLRRARAQGVAAPDLPLPGEPDVTLVADEPLLHPAEERAGLAMPVALYAILESARRAAGGLSVPDHAHALAERYARFSEIAADNPQAWSRQPLSVEEIERPGPRNALQAAPYLRRHCTSWNVDQAAALLFTSEVAAERLGLDRSRWVHPWASTEANHMAPVCVRADLAASPGARLAGEAALAAGGLAIGNVDLIELYSCFPVAVEAVAAELGVPAGRDLTVTGGMAAAGGPFNNYVLQATCRMAALLRERPRATGLVSSLSGILTKQAFGLWSSAPAPDGFVHRDVTAAVAAASPARAVDEAWSGEATIAGYTVVPQPNGPLRSIVVADTPDGQRTFCTSDDPGTAASLSRDDHVGRRIVCDGAGFVRSSCRAPGMISTSFIREPGEN